MLAWSVGPQEVVLILIVVLLLFGGKKLPELAKGLARGLKAFKSELKDVKKEFEDDDSNNKDDTENPYLENKQDHSTKNHPPSHDNEKDV